MHMFRRPVGKSERLMVRQSFIPKGAKLVPGPAGGAAYKYEAGGKPYAIAFRGSAGNPDFHHWYRSEAERDAKIAQFHESLKSSAEYKSKRAAEKKAWVNTFKPGDVLYTSYGYDQTNVAFYGVTRVSGKRVWLKKAYGTYEETGYMVGRSTPVYPVRFVENAPETMHIAREGGVTVDGHHASLAEPGKSHHTSSYA